MLIIGLTGSIGMGKSETTRMFREEGVPVYDADAAVHQVYAKGGAAVQALEEAFPGVTRDGAVDRELLSKRILGDDEAVKKVGQIVYPKIGEIQREFMADAKAANEPLVVLDIPLLFETSGGANVDKIVVVSAPSDMQRKRVLARAEMTEEKFEAILRRQMPDSEKREKADFIVDTGKGLEHAHARVREIIKELLEG
jgi:dephospho-CoA kinase